jgi:hypothetical protein
MNLMIGNHLVILAAAALAAPAIHAAPVEYDAPEYHLIVCRPFDSWSGDTSVMAGERETIADRRGRISYRDVESGGHTRGAGITLLNGPTDDAVTTEVVSQFKQRGVSVSGRGSYHWTMGLPTELEPGAYDHLKQAQSLLYDALIRRQGDPDAIAGSMKARHVLGSVLAVAAIGVSMDKFGGIGGSVVATTFAGDIAQLPVGVRQSFAPFDLPDLDTHAFTKIEVYPVKVNEGGSPGQVIVAYKGAASPTARQAALVQAIVSVAGADTTPEAIDQARTADLKRRRETWASCATADACPASRQEGEAAK